jgi:hypothetical protein
MADLSTVQARTTQRDRKVNRRAGIIPERRNTDNGTYRPQGDMRSARIGDGGAADELRAIFGGLEKTAETFQQYTATKQAKADERDSAQGQIDSITGAENPELAAKSNAYRTSFSKGKTERETLTFMDTVSQEVEAFLNNPDDPATPEEVDEFLHGKLQEYLRPEGQPRDFGSPEAAALTYGHLREWSAKLRSGAVDKIKEQVATESLNNAADNVRLRLKQGLPVTLKDYNDQLIDTVAPEAAQKAFLGAVQGVVEELKLTDPKRAIAILDMVSGEVRAAAGETATAEDQTAEANILAGDPTEPYYGTEGKPAAKPAAKPATGRNLSKGEIVQHVLIDLEGGGKVVDNGDGAGTTKYGITAKYNPGVDIANLTEAQATQIAIKKYWFKELDGVSPALAAIAFDAGYVGGTSVGKKILAASGGDPEKAAALYRAHLNHLADTSPRHAKFKKGWNNRINRLVAKVGLSGTGVVGQDIGTILDIPIVDGAIYRAPSAADLAEQGPLDGSVPRLGGDPLLPVARGFSLSQEQRNQLRQYRTSVLNDIRQDDARKTKERFDEGARTLLSRFIGIGGGKPTVAEIQTMVKDGTIDPETGYQTVQRLETDAREQRSEERQVQALQREERQEVREIKRERMERRANAFLAPVFAGQKSISQATAELLARSNAIADPEERNEFRTNVYRELQAVSQLRTESAPYQTFMRNMDDLGGELKGLIHSGVRGPVRKHIEAFIDSEIARVKVQGGRYGQDEGYDLTKYNDTMEQRIVETFRRRGYNQPHPKIR